MFSVAHPMAVESPDPGLADSGKDSPIQLEDSGKNSSPREDSPTALTGQDGKHTTTVTSACMNDLGYPDETNATSIKTNVSWKCTLAASRAAPW